MVKRRSLSPPAEAEGIHATRRDGARREVTQRVLLERTEQNSVVGWALNVSRGGIRLIVEERVELGEELDVQVEGEAEGASGRRRGRIVWVQEEQDGMIVGVQYLDAEGEPEPPPGATN